MDYAGKMRSLKVTLTLIFSGFFLNSCAFSQFNLTQLQSAGYLTPDFSSDPGYELTLVITEKKHWGWNGGSRDDRNRTVSKLFKYACKERTPTILEEVALPKQTSDSAEPQSWLLKVKCI